MSEFKRKFRTRFLRRNSGTDTDDRQWQQEMINRLAFAAINEQRRHRRWNIFFRTLLFAYLFLILFMIYLPGDLGKNVPVKGPHTALIEINGVIASNTEASADNIISGLRKAFENDHSRGIILRINSPGGSPVQAGYVYDEIKRLRKLYTHKKIYAVVTDMCASGGYYIAAAADEIYADKASIVGSIGVLMSGFGFPDAMKKIGIERRLYTAGENKGFMDPFSSVKEKDIKHIREMLDTIHQQFINTVKAGRGDRLAKDDRLFSGLFWTGEESVELGLVDGLGSSSFVARELIRQDRIVDYTPRPDYFERFADRLGVAMANSLFSPFNIQ